MNNVKQHTIYRGVEIVRIGHTYRATVVIPDGSSIGMHATLLARSLSEMKADIRALKLG